MISLVLIYLWCFLYIISLVFFKNTFGNNILYPCRGYTLYPCRGYMYTLAEGIEHNLYSLAEGIMFP